MFAVPPLGLRPQRRIHRGHSLRAFPVINTQPGTFIALSLRCERLRFQFLNRRIEPDFRCQFTQGNLLFRNILGRRAFWRRHGLKPLQLLHGLLGRIRRGVRSRQLKHRLPRENGLLDLLLIPAGPSRRGVGKIGRFRQRNQIRVWRRRRFWCRCWSGSRNGRRAACRISSFNRMNRSEEKDSKDRVGEPVHRAQSIKSLAFAKGASKT